MMRHALPHALRRVLLFCMLCLLPVSLPDAAQCEENFFESMEKAGVALKRALAGPDKGESAELYFLSDLDGGTVYKADFALSWKPGKTWDVSSRTTLSFEMSVEGRLTSEESESEDALRSRASIIADTYQGWHFDSLYTSISLKHEADRDFDIQKLTAEVVLTPTMRALCIGRACPASVSREEQPGLQFRWRPFMGLDAGRTLEKGESAEKEDAVLRLLARGRAEIYLNFLRNALRMEEVFIFADNSFFYLPLEEAEETHNFLTAGLTFQISKHVSIGATYKNGEDSPEFQRIETFGGTIGLRI